MEKQAPQLPPDLASVIASINEALAVANVNYKNLVQAFNELKQKEEEQKKKKEQS